MKPKNTICLWFDKDALEAARVARFTDEEWDAYEETYLDGVERAAVAHTGIVTDPDAFLIDLPATTAVDDVEIWDNPLTAAEVESDLSPLRDVRLLNPVEMKSRFRVDEGQVAGLAIDDLIAELSAQQGGR